MVPLQSKRVTRRELLRQAVGCGGWVALASMLPACGLPARPATTPVPPGLAPPGPKATSTVLPVPIKEEEMVQLAFVKTRDRAEGVKQALHLLADNSVQNKQVLLKPNFNSAHPAPASTHPDTLCALTDELWQMGARSITVADRSGMGVTRRVMEDLGVFDMAAELGFDVQALDELTAQDWELVHPSDSHWKDGFPFARPCLEAEALVQTCCLKPHRFGGHFTISLKNSVGMVASVVPGADYNYMHELHSSRYQRLLIAEINAAYTPALVVLDAVEAFINAGPEQGARRWGEAVLAGTDRVAIDAVGLAMLRHLGYSGVAAKGSVYQQEQIARAVELGLGADAPQKIQLLTADPDSESYAAQIMETLLSA